MFYTDNDKMKRTIYISQLEPEELAELEETLKNVRVTPHCRGRPVGCRCATTRNNVSKGRPHWVGSRDNLVREDFYVVKFNKDLSIRRATVCGKCNDLDLNEETPEMKQRRREREELKKILEGEVEKLAPLLILLGDKLQKLRTIMTLHGNEARAELIDAFFKNMDGREYMEVIKILQEEDWISKVVKRPNETDASHQKRIKDETLMMVQTVIKSIDLSHKLEYLDEDTAVMLQATAMGHRFLVENNMTENSHLWLPATTEGAVYVFLKQFGFEFKAPWMEAMKAAAIEEGLIDPDPTSEEE